MGRGASKAEQNPYYRARIEASKWNEKLKSREGAAELLSMSVDAVQDAELGLYKVMPVDKAVRMADLYNAPWLLNYYCLHECPIGCDQPISDCVSTIDRVTISLVTSATKDKLNSMRDRLLAVAADGKITPDEVDVLNGVIQDADEIIRAVSELKTLTKMVENSGTE